MNGLTKFDLAKLSLYGVAVCGALSVALLNTILKPWGWDDASIASLSAKIGSISALFGLVGIIANTFKNPSPPSGMVSVTAPKDAVPIRVKDLSTSPPPPENAKP